MRKRTWTVDQLREAVAGSESIATVLKKLSLRPTGGNYAQFRKYFQEYNIDTSHFTGQAWNIGLKFHPSPPKSLTEILVYPSHYKSSSLRERLIKERIFQHQCTNCKLTTWLGNPIPLELEHINGDSTDNRIENLTLLCPNCHTLTPTYRRKKSCLKV